jgi:hypothetical protein
VATDCSPQARRWGARALLRAMRRGDEAMGEESMLTPVSVGRQRHRRMASHERAVVLDATEDTEQVCPRAAPLRYEMQANVSATTGRCGHIVVHL